jgi:hypothetical protein
MDPPDLSRNLTRRESTEDVRRHGSTTPDETNSPINLFPNRRNQ